jgi:hypothetical protein
MTDSHNMTLTSRGVPRANQAQRRGYAMMVRALLGWVVPILFCLGGLLGPIGSTAAFAASTSGFSDNFTNRGVLNGYSNFVTGANSGYTKEQGEPPHADRKGTHSAWLSWIAPDAGTCVMDTLGSGFDTVLAVYIGNTVSNLSLVANNDDAGGGSQSQVSFVAVANVAYQIAVDGYGSNDFGSIVFHQDLSNGLPTIVIQPQSQVVVAGSNAMFSVTGRGASPLGYQWYFNGAVLNGATGATFQVTGAQPTNEGNYFVVVSNSLGSVTSIMAGLTVLVPPSILVQPQGQSVDVGVAVQFSVTATGSTPLFYQWRFESNAQPGATNPVFNLANVQRTSQGNYSVVVSNSVGSVTSAVAFLSVGFPPTITLQPQSQTVFQGSNVTFSVLATSATPLSYQWFIGVVPFPGATNASLVISNVQPAYAGSYNVVVSNAGGSITSQVATLNVIVPAMIAAQPQNRTAIAGSTVAFTVSVLGQPPFFYQWRFNQTNIAGENGSTLTITNVQRNHAGSYDVVVTNVTSVLTSSNAVLDVRYSLATSIAGRGNILRNPDLSTYLPGSVALLTAVPTPGFDLLNWSGAASGNAYEITLLMDTNKSVVANFLTNPPLVFTIQGSGTVLKSPDKPAYRLGESVLLTATAGRYYSFSRWDSGISNTLRQIMIQTNNSYVAIFSPTTALETLTFGNVTRRAPVGMPAVFVNGQFVVSNAVTQVASAQVSMLTTFPHGAILYSLDGSEPSFLSTPYDGPFTLNHTAPIRAIAYDALFSQSWEADPVQVVIVPTFSLNAFTPGGGIVLATPASGLYTNNSLIQITAAPIAGWSFLGWLGDVAGVTPTRGLLMSRDRCVEAVFGTSLSNTVAGSGSVSISPGGPYPYGAVARLTAVPGPGSYFALWGNAGSGQTNPLNFTVTSANPSVSALFVPLSAGQVALTVLADLNGRVTVTPPGNHFTNGQVVTLTAVPDAGQSFLGWGNAASGTQNPLPVVLNQSKVITAQFSDRPRLSPVLCRGVMDAGQFQLRVNGLLGRSYVIEASEDLELPWMAWMPLGTVTNTLGAAQFNDPFVTNRTQRFYRTSPAP